MDDLHLREISTTHNYSQVKRRLDWDDRGTSAVTIPSATSHHRSTTTTSNNATSANYKPSSASSNHNATSASITITMKPSHGPTNAANTTSIIPATTFRSGANGMLLKGQTNIKQEYIVVVKQQSGEDHVFKTPNKPASALSTPSRKRKASGGSSNASDSSSSNGGSNSSPQRTTNVITLHGKDIESFTTHKSRTIPGLFASLTNAALLAPPPIQRSLPSSPASNSSKATKHRYETSLGQLTKKFINLLKQAPEGVGRKGDSHFNALI